VGTDEMDLWAYCRSIGVAMGLGPHLGPRIMKAFTSAERPTVLWLSFGHCTGCKEHVRRSTSPWFDETLFDSVFLSCQDVLQDAGRRTEQILSRVANLFRGKFFCVLEGEIPSEKDGIQWFTGGKRMLDASRMVCPEASAVIALGDCVPGRKLSRVDAGTEMNGEMNRWGRNVPFIHIPGCPPDPLDFIATLAHQLLYERLPDLDDQSRPLFASKPFLGHPSGIDPVEGPFHQREGKSG
jgi:[NiFe] hydrogenase small subunit